MKIFITGGTGLIGSRLVNLLLTQEHVVTVYTRNVDKASQKLGGKPHFVTSLDTDNLLEGYDAVINLAGEPIAGGLWTKKRKKLLAESRIKITRRLAQLIKESKNPPSVFISGSAIGYYGSQEDRILTENSDCHDEFTYRLCKQWEAEAENASNQNTRVCLLRTGIVLSSQGGALSKMALPFKLGLGATLGSGNQYISWIHICDMVASIVYLLKNSSAIGAFNLTSPEPITNRVFSHTMANILHRPCLFRIPRFVMSLVLGESATMLIDGQRAIPQKLDNLGFKFKYPNVKDALKNIFNQEK